MNPREKLERVYALAFDPPSLNDLWHRIKLHEVDNIDEAAELVEMALMLHRRSPMAAILHSGR